MVNHGSWMMDDEMMRKSKQLMRKAMNDDDKGNDEDALLNYLRALHYSIMSDMHGNDCGYAPKTISHVLDRVLDLRKSVDQIDYTKLNAEIKVDTLMDIVERMCGSADKRQEQHEQEERIFVEQKKEEPRGEKQLPQDQQLP